MHNKFPTELEFLKGFYNNPENEYKYSSWLLSDFDAPIWKYTFNFVTPNEINWNIVLDDDSSLLSPKNKYLLVGFKYLLTTSTRSARSSGIELGSNAAQHTMFNRAIHIIDYILRNAKEYKLSSFGLAGLNSNHLKRMLSIISSINNSVESIYEWTQTVSKFCLTLVESIEKADLEETLNSYPDMRIVTEDQAAEHALEFNSELIPYARAALYLKGFYKKSREGNTRNLNTLKLAKLLYINTLRRGRLKLLPLKSLAITSGGELFGREFPASSVRTGEHETMTAGPFRAYRFLTYNLGVLHEIGLPAPEISELRQILEFEPRLSEAARFRTLPYPVVRDAFKQAVEYHFEYGSMLIEGFCRMAEHCALHQINPTRLTNEELRDILGPRLVEIGVRQIGLSCRTVSTDFVKVINRDEYFLKLRGNVGLAECLCIYIACAQLVIGTIMARRVGEMLDLHSANCLDKSERWLIFSGRKTTSNLYGIRRRQARPIEPIAVKMIKNLISMQQRLLDCGYISEMTNLFASPDGRGNTGLIPAAIHSYQRNLDLFCDYFELPLNSKGERYYIRQHQLRRFFSMLFFHSSSLGGLETLQWMLGHTDMYHVWNYITESVDGAVLQNAKAQFIAESLHNGDIAAYEDLATLLKTRYGTDNFSLVDTDELEDAITDLMENGEVKIEPEFFSDEKGQHMRVIVKIKSPYT